jgi:hypothetical protein
MPKQTKYLLNEWFYWDLKSVHTIFELIGYA